MTSSPWIRIRDVSRYYKRGTHEVRAVDRASLTIERGEFLAVVGASGSGKSTLLNLIAGLDTPTNGTIHVGEQSLTTISSRELASYRAQRVGIIFQSFNLLPHQTALRNVETAMMFTGVPKLERTARAEQMLDRLGLSDRADHLPPALSGGEQQRVAIARALVKNPDILFADEPTGNLDQDNTTAIADLLSEFHQDGLTVVMVTHDMELAHGNAGRVLRMVYGRMADPDRENET